MDFFERHKALIITSLLCAILLLTMYNINVSNSNKKVRETLIELNDLRAEETQKEVEKPEEKQEQQQEPAPPRRPNLQTHQAFNQNQQESQSNTKARLEEIFQKNAAQQEASEDNAASQGDFNLNKAAKKKQQQSEGNNTSEETSVKKGSYRNSSIAFSLAGRQAIDIPNPIYTCDNSGKIVVNITVNQQGAVTSTSINKGSSTSSNECLMAKALEYAAGAIFTKLPGRNSQPGTITYYFQD